MSKVLASKRYKPASAKESEAQLKRIRNGLNIEQGFALDFSLANPVLRITDEYTKEIDAERAVADKWQAEAEKEMAEVADLLLPIESFATMPRNAGDNTPVAQPAAS